MWFLQLLLLMEYGHMMMFQSDSEYMAGQLSAYGYTLIDTPEEADLWLINT